MKPSYHLEKLMRPNRDETYFSGIKDPVIWNMFISGDDHAFTFVYQNYAQRLFRYGCQFSNPEIVKDCVQELFTELIRNRERLGPTYSIKFYLYKSLRRKLFRWRINVQKRTLRNLMYHDTQNINFEDSVETKWVINNSEMAQKRWIQYALDKLPPKQQEAILLFYYEGLSHKQIAEIMQLPNVKSIQNLLYRSISHLEEILRGKEVHIY